MSHYDIHVGDVIKYPEMVMTRTVQRRGIYFGKSIDASQYYFGKIDTDGSAVDMSHQGIWADALAILALNLTICVIESNPGFLSVTNISPLCSETDTTVRNVGHETQYVLTVPSSEGIHEGLHDKKAKK